MTTLARPGVIQASSCRIRSDARMLENVGRPDWVDSNLYPFHDNWIGIDGNSIHYVDEGPRNAPVLLFIHPGPGWSFTYRYHIKQLSDKFRCIAPDLPGYGLSEAAEGYDYSLHSQSHALGRFVQTLDLRNMVVWGNDGGGPGFRPCSGSRCRRYFRLVNQEISVGSMDAARSHKPCLPLRKQVHEFSRLVDGVQDGIGN